MVVFCFTKDIYGYIKIYIKIFLKEWKMKQLLVKLSDEEYRLLDTYCRQTGRTKSAVIRYYIANLRKENSTDYLRRKVKRISSGKGGLVSDIIREMRR